MVKISAVSYLNTKPFVYGLEAFNFGNSMDLSLDIPSMCAEKLISGRVDLGLVPVATIPKLATPHIISDYCIGSVGAVQTVCLYSHQPLQNVRKIRLDYQSRTSAQLTKTLVEHYWKFQPEYIAAQPNYEKNIGLDEAALVIGDRTIGLEKHYEYCYDLGEIWQQFTGLPFVFAAWVSNRPLPATFVQKFNAALAFGIQNIDTVVRKYQAQEPYFDLKKYYTTYINYNLDTAKRAALSLFLSYMNGKPNEQMELVYE